MKITALSPSQVVYKCENYRWEKCFMVYLGDKIVDVIQNEFGDLEVIKFAGTQMFRVSFSLTGVL